MEQEKFPLTKNQQQVFDLIESTTDNVYVGGKPGTGKSVLIRALTNDGRKTYNRAAPTGLAANNIDARTLHSTFGLPISDGIIHPAYDLYPDPYTKERIYNNIKYSIKYLIIDEISMVRCDVLDYIDRMCRHIRGNDNPFGGIQVICIGDFFQLPPIVRGPERKDLKLNGWESEFAFSAKVWSSFKNIQLTEVLRQKGDLPFLGLLDNARTGDVHPSQLKVLNKQIGKPDDIRIELYAVNKQADEVNQTKLRLIKEPAISFTARKFGEWAQDPLDPNLTIKVGAQVMVKMNGADRPPTAFKKGGDKFVSQVVNGTLGIVEEIVKENPSDNVDEDFSPYVLIRTNEDKTIKIYIQRFERKRKVEINGKWAEEVVASFVQMPLALAWAISLHKSQGMTLDRVHLDFSRVFADGQAYVGLSRCRTIEGISLQSGVVPGHFRTNVDVLNFMESITV